MNLKTTLIVLVLFFSSCDYYNKKEKVPEEEKKEELRGKENSKITEAIISKYNIKYRLNSLNAIEYPLSIDYKPVIESKFQLIESFEVKDIYEKDSLIFISIKSGYYPIYYLTLHISKDQEIKFAKLDPLMSPHMSLVVSIASIRKLDFALESEIEDSDGSPSLVINNSTDYIGKGQIIEIIELK